MYKSAEREFYRRHYGGSLLREAPNLDRIYADSFAPGKRYHLLCNELVVDQHSRTVAEVGCSSGEALMFLVREFHFGRAIGMDIAIEAPTTINGIDFFPANFNERLPLPDASVDVFIAMMVIEHVFDPFHAFSEIKRVLSPRGTAFVNLPLITSVKNRLRLLIGKVPETSVPIQRWFVDNEWDGNHLHYFSVPSIHRLAHHCGLQVQRMSGVGPGHKIKSLFPSFLANEITFTLRANPSST